MKRFYSLVDRMTTFARHVAALGVLIIVFITCLDIVLRFFYRPIYGSYDIIRVIEGIVISFSLVYTQSQNGHLSLDLFVSHLETRKHAIVNTINSIIAFSFMLLLVYIVLNDAFTMLKTNLLSMSLGFPLYPFAYAIALGCLMMCPRILIDFLHSLKEASKK